MRKSLSAAVALAAALALMPAGAQDAGLRIGVYGADAGPSAATSPRPGEDKPPPTRGIPPLSSTAGDVVAPEIVLRRLSRQGFYGFREMVRRGDYYVVRAYAPHGSFVRVVVDGNSGEIIGVRVLASTGDGRDADLSGQPR